MTTQARGVTLSPRIAELKEASKRDDYHIVGSELREVVSELTASLEREAELRAEVERLRGKPFSDRMYAALESRLAAAQNAALTRENEQSAIDAATVEERFELGERLKVAERAYTTICHELGYTDEEIAEILAAARAELAKEKANG